ncbi:hypothetical protein BT63DRAFT_455514 [Microthyrium microscopicum]|uniref:Uncharacterized protein n=1 Tax=Microthyrium microscopicum TaxID=703497 RepID=A0A6A6UDR1_9PEZI|nr:hypothetical protein BT63DRAFT_455514 [Microthyrium microscopicum]
MAGVIYVPLDALLSIVIGSESIKSSIIASLERQYWSMTSLFNVARDREQAQLPLIPVEFLQTQDPQSGGRCTASHRLAAAVRKTGLLEAFASCSTDRSNLPMVVVADRDREWIGAEVADVLAIRNVDVAAVDAGGGAVGLDSGDVEHGADES